MKQEDFERLKAVCEKEGFTIESYCGGKTAIIGVKDIWDAVEFAEYIHSPMKNLSHFKIIRSDEKWLYMSDGSELFKHNCKPSTEQAYIEQLKKEAHERFGEIKEGDRFDRTTIDEKWGSNTIMVKSPFGNFHWKYDRSSDTLFIGSFGIYSKGKWATRVKERVKITPLHTTTEKRNNDWKIDFSFSANNRNFSLNGVSTFLASQLEAYLNLDGYSVDVSGETLSIHVKIRNGVDLEDLKEKAESLAKIVKKI